MFKQKIQAFREKLLPFSSYKSCAKFLVQELLMQNDAFKNDVTGTSLEITSPDTLIA